MEKEEHKSKASLIISCVVILVILLSYFFIPSVNGALKEAFNVLTSDDTAKIENWVGQFGIWGPIVIILIMVIQLFLIVIPSVIIMIIAVLAYGPLVGSFITLIGILISSSVGYKLGDYLGDVTIEKFLGKKTLQKIESYVKNYGIWTIILVRVSPFLSHDGISFVSGVVEMSYRKFITATFFGSLPLILLIAIFGESFNKLKPGLIIGSVLSIIVFILYIIIDKKRNKSNLQNQ